MPPLASTAQCASTLEPRLSAGEAAVVIVIVLSTAVLAHHGTSLPHALTLLGNAGLLALALIRLRTTGWRPGALRRAGKALLSSPA